MKFYGISCYCPLIHTRTQTHTYLSIYVNLGKECMKQLYLRIDMICLNDNFSRYVSWVVKTAQSLLLRFSLTLPPPPCSCHLLLTPPPAHTTCCSHHLLLTPPPAHTTSLLTLLSYHLPAHTTSLLTPPPCSHYLLAHFILTPLLCSHYLCLTPDVGVGGSHTKQSSVTPAGCPMT